MMYFVNNLNKKKTNTNFHYYYKNVNYFVVELLQKKN